MIVRIHAIEYQSILLEEIERVERRIVRRFPMFQGNRLIEGKTAEDIAIDVVTESWIRGEHVEVLRLSDFRMRSMRRADRDAADLVEKSVRRGNLHQAIGKALARRLMA